MPNTLTWTLLPNGTDNGTANGRARLSLVAHPSVESVTGELNDTPLLDWPGLLAGVGRLHVQVDGGPTLTADRVDVVDRSLWRDLFPLTTRVAAGPGPGDDSPFAALADTFDYAAAHAAAVGLYADAVSTSPTELIGPDHPVARTLAALGATISAERAAAGVAGALPSGAGAAGVASANEAPGKASEAGSSGPAAVPDPVAAARASALAAVVRQLTPRRTAPPGVVLPPDDTPSPLDGVGSVEEADVHQVLTLVRDHPALARLLGIVVDLTLPLTGALHGEQSLRIVADGGQAPLRALFDEVRTPWSRTVCDPATGLFTMATRPGPGTEIVRGMLDLSPDTTKYVVGTADVVAAARQLGSLGVAHHAGTAPLGLPARHDTGFTLAQSGRQQGTVTHAAQALARLQESGVLFADDVTSGYRVDVARGDGPFRSLMRRVASYRVGQLGGRAPLVAHDEGLVEPLVAVQQTAADGTHQLSISEEFAGWGGWSLAVPVPGLAVVAEEANGPAVAAVAPQAAPGYDLTIDIAAEPGSLERLRYGQRYRFRARAVDLAGNSLSPERADRADTAGFTSASTRFSRTETVSPPVLLLRTPLRAGETLRRLVVTSDGDGNPLDAVTQRHLAPPSASQLLTERHGLLDDALGPRATAAERDAVLALAARESRSFADPMVATPGGGTAPAAGLTVVAPPGQTPATLPLPAGQALPAGQYLVHDTDVPVVPYLPDVAARGASLIVAFADPGEVTMALYGGRWPDPRPVRLRLNALTESRAPLFAAGTDDGRGTLDVSLAAGDELTVSLASPVRVEALDVMEPMSANAHALAQLGQVPAISPREQLTFVHATRRPLDRITWGQTTATAVGATRLRVQSQVDCHRASTAKLDLVADWEEIVDPGYGPVTTVPRTAVLGSAAVPTGFDAPFAWSSEYDFGDTRRRDLTLRLVGSTRYRDCFPDLTEGDPLGQRAVSLPPLVRRNGRRPAPPEIAAVVPTYRWVRSTTGTTFTSERRRAGVRVWLERPWMTTGPGEALGVVAWSSTQFATLLQNTGLNQAMMSRWGVDLIEENGPRPGDPFTAASFPAGVAHPEDLPEISAFPEAPGQPPATVVAHEVRFDEQRQQWFADVDVTIPDARPAMLRLALVRYQPQSPNGARVSRMVTTDWIPLQPPRTLQLVSLSPTGVDVSVKVSGRHAEDRVFSAAVRPRLVDPPAGGTPTDITTGQGALQGTLISNTVLDGVFTALGRLTSTATGSALARLRAGQVVVQEHHGGYKIRTDDTTSRVEWVEVVDFSQIQPT